jgi:shikimate dehydrogenase
MFIDGRTNLVGLIGGSLERSPSPAMHNVAFRALGLNWCYLPLRVEPECLEPALEGLLALDFRGVNVTIPHKLKAASLADRLEGEAHLIRSVNTLLFVGGEIIGYNTDVNGLLRSLREAEVHNADSVFLIGAGGAARAAALAMARMGAESIFIFNRSRSRADELANLLMEEGIYREVEVLPYDRSNSRALGECAMVVNSTPLSQERPEELPLDYEAFKFGQVVIDLNYVRHRSAFLKEAERRGSRVVNGRTMLLYQAAESFQLWTGEKAPIAAMRGALDEVLIGENVRKESPGG